MDQKKSGNIMILICLLIFLFSSFLLICNINMNRSVTKINKLNDSFITNRKEELQAYDFYFNETLENDSFIRNENTVIVKTKNYYYQIYENDNVILMKKVLNV